MYSVTRDLPRGGRVPFLFSCEKRSRMAACLMIFHRGICGFKTSKMALGSFPRSVIASRTWGQTTYLVNGIGVMQNQRSSKTERSDSLTRRKRPYNYAARKNGFPATDRPSSKGFDLTP